MIFPVGKKGQLGKKILFYVLQVYDFPFFLTIINKHLIYTVISSYVHRYGYLRAINQIGIEQAIQWAAWRPWILFHQHGDHLYFLIQIIQYGLYSKSYLSLVQGALITLCDTDPPNKDRTRNTNRLLG